MIRRFPWLLLLGWLAGAALGQQQPPTPEEFLRYKLGDRFTPHHRIVDYFQELAKRSNLVSVQNYGETYEGRPLILAAITSPKNRAALETIRRDVGALAGRETIDAARAGEIARSTPAIVWLAFGIHGNESSSAEAAMLIASTLLREESSKLLDNLVVLIDPLQNPDGRERYINWFHRMRGRQANANPDSFEHTEPWPGGRYNHYLMDMNRDWTWMSQRETQARVTLYGQWNPQVFVDFHEMSAQSTYFFPPGAKPINANVPKDIEKWLDVFGRANAGAFSQKGWPFFVAERFDLFYPGYGDSWPSLRGAIGMTYEVAGGGRGGTEVTRDDGTVLSLSDRIQRHFTTGMTTLRTASENREALLQYTQRAISTQLENARDTFLIEESSPNFERLIELLQKQSIEVRRLAAPVSLRATRIDSETPETHAFRAGTAVVSTRQPAGALAQTLLEKSPAISKGFLDEQRMKTEADEEDDFYDLTTWSLPLAMNVETWVTTAALNAETSAYQVEGRPTFRAASYGYLVDGLDPNVYRFAGLLLAEKVRFSITDSDIVVGDRTFSRGTLIILKAINRPDLDAALERISHAAAVYPFPLASGWMGGTALGSERIRFVKEPKIALVGGVGTGATSFGMLWHTLDIDTPIPHSIVSMDALRGLDLERYNVLVLPDGEVYGDRLGKRGIEKLQNWLRNGGTLIAIRGASAFLRGKDVEISKLRPWEPPKKKDDEAKPAEERYNDYRIPGSAFRAVMSERSYLTFGIPRPPAVLIQGSLAFLPVSHRVDNIMTIQTQTPLISGVAWPESLERLKGSAYLVNEPYGRGSVITFADEPHFRLFWRATLPLFLNAVLYSQTFPR